MNEVSLPSRQKDSKLSPVGLDVIVWCGMSEICLILKVLAKMYFIVFLTLLGVK